MLTLTVTLTLTLALTLTLTLLLVQSCPFSVTSTVVRQLSSSHRSLRGSGTSFQLSSILWLSSGRSPVSLQLSRPDSPEGRSVVVGRSSFEYSPPG